MAAAGGVASMTRLEFNKSSNRSWASGGPGANFRMEERQHSVLLLDAQACRPNYRVLDFNVCKLMRAS